MNDDRTVGGPPGEDPSRDLEPTLDAPSAGQSAGNPSDAATVILPGAERPGTIIGPYKILQQIGEGGFGSVFMAEQEKPVQRMVALKIIKLGMDTRQVVARFEQERQALAMMDHPNIARVYDAGATETGRPYFAMELVKGEPIVHYCDKNNLSIEARLDLFAQVCNAVQHAHTKGIIHRDIKPTNILVSTQDGRPHAKVIDFGIAKATASKLTEKTLFTEFQQLIGTPEYMSPEQAEGSLDIDTRTDVYSLGAVLYELLTGSTPFSGRDLRSAAFAEIQRMIREVDPPKPSTRLSQNAATLTSIAAARRTEPKRLGTVVRGELDWIVMRALEKDRQRRYETASGLGADIRRYLSGDNVVAAPPSTAYRVHKFVRRNKGKVAAGAAVGAALVLGLVGTVWQAQAAADQRDKARQEATRALAAEFETRRRAEDLQRVADFQGQMLAQVDPTAAGMRLTDDVSARLDAALAKANLSDEDRAARTDAFIGMWSQISATDAALTLIDRTILRPAVSAIDTQFEDQPEIAATLRHVVAERYHDLGLDAEAVALQERVVEARRRLLGEDNAETVKSIGNLGVYQASLAMHKEAEASYREALERGRRLLGEDDPVALVYLANVGSILVQTGRFDEAEPVLREALERRRRVLGDESPDTITSIRDWGDLLMHQGKFAEAEPLYREMLEKRRRVLGEENPATLSALNDMAILLQNQGRLEEALVYLREAVEKKRRVVGEVHPSTLSTVQSLGAVLDMNGQSAEAETLMRDTLAKQQELLGRDHTSTMTTMGNLSALLVGQGRFAEAEPLCRETLERRTRVMGPDHASTLIANNVMGLVLIRQKRYEECEPYWREAAAIGRRVLGPAHPETLVYVHNLGGLAYEQGKFAEAEESYQEVITLGVPALGMGQPVVLSAHRRLGAILVEQKRYADAVDVLARAEPESRNASTGANQRSLAMLLKDLGTARAGLGEFEASETNLLEAHAIFVTVRGEEHAETIACARALAEMYEAWDKAEPDNGHGAKGDAWREKIPS